MEAHILVIVVPKTSVRHETLPTGQASLTKEVDEEPT